MKNQYKIIFSLVGIFSLVKIIQGYGVGTVWDEFHSSGFFLILLVLTFIPTLICYAIAWLLATDHQQMDKKFSLTRKISLFVKFTAVSIAWNNLTPFIKVGGEPLKYFMLSKYISNKKAIQSTVNYNIIHLVATMLSFIVAALVLTLFYHVPEKIIYYSWGLIASCLVLVYLFYKMIMSNLNSFVRRKIFRISFINSKIAMRRLIYFYKSNPSRFLLSIFFDTVARFVEGLTFYFGFMIIKHPVSILTASFLDVARTFVDTLFFFIPYQIGSREQGVKFFMDKILFIDASGFLTAVLFYRFVEIAWMFIGYGLWINLSKSSNEPVV
jgi:hypothetical protein